jgi:hypothetical protein
MLKLFLESPRPGKERCSPTYRSVLAPMKLDNRSISQILLITIIRPAQMFFMEAIAFFSCLYIILVFSILFLFFQAYIFIFRDLYGMSTSNATLAFIPMGLGTIFSMSLFILYNNFREKAQKRDATWESVEEYRRLPLACVGGLLLTILLFWSHGHRINQSTRLSP